MRLSSNCRIWPLSAAIGGSLGSIDLTIDEDVDAIGISILSGAHMTLFPRVLELLREQGRDDILITGGGILPREDIEELQRRGIGKLFGPGTPTTDLVDYIKAWFAERQQQEA